MLTKSDMCPEEFSGHPVGRSQKDVCIGVWQTWLQSCPCNPPANRPWISLYGRVCLSFQGQDTLIWCPRFTILACFALPSPLPLTPQEMAPLSLGEEVAWSRPLAQRIDGGRGKLLIITYKWKTCRDCSVSCLLRNILEQWIAKLQLATCTRRQIRFKYSWVLKHLLVTVTFTVDLSAKVKQGEQKIEEFLICPDSVQELPNWSFLTLVDFWHWKQQLTK